MKRYNVVTLAATATIMSLLAACSTGGSNNSTAGTDGEISGSLTVACGAMEDLCQKWTSAFTEKTGVKTDFVRLSSGETVARLAASKDSPEFDVWHGGPVDGFGAAKNEGLIEAYESANAAKIPERYRDAEGYWNGVYIGVLGFCSNQKQLDKLGVEVPTSWDALLDPKLKGQISTAHPSTSGTAFTTLWTQVALGGSDDAGLDYMSKMHSNVLQYSKSRTAPGQLAGRGEVGVGLVFSHDCVKYQNEGMTDLVVSFPKEGTGWEIGGVALIKGSKNPAAAKAYIDWTLTPEAQNLGAEVGSFQVLTNPDSLQDDRMVKLDDVKLIDYDFIKAAAEKKALTARFDDEIAAQPRE